MQTFEATEFPSTSRGQWLFIPSGSQPLWANQPCSITPWGPQLPNAPFPSGMVVMCLSRLTSLPVGVTTRWPVSGVPVQSTQEREFMFQSRRPSPERTFYFLPEDQVNLSGSHPAVIQPRTELFHLPTSRRSRYVSPSQNLLGSSAHVSRSGSRDSREDVRLQRLVRTRSRSISPASRFREIPSSESRSVEIVSRDSPQVETVRSRVTVPSISARPRRRSISDETRLRRERNRRLPELSRRSQTDSGTETLQSRGRNPRQNPTSTSTRTAPCRRRRRH